MVPTLASVPALQESLSTRRLYVLRVLGDLREVGALLMLPLDGAGCRNQGPDLGSRRRP